MSNLGLIPSKLLKQLQPPKKLLKRRSRFLFLFTCNDSASYFMTMRYQIHSQKKVLNCYNKTTVILSVLQNPHHSFSVSQRAISTILIPSKSYSSCFVRAIIIFGYASLIFSSGSDSLWNVSGLLISSAT